MTESFFESEVVVKCMTDIVELQSEVILFAEYAQYATLEQQRENLVVLRELQAKQKNMCFRCILSDDPDAKILLSEIMAHFESFGHKVDPDNMLAVFDEVGNQLQEIEDDLDYAEKHGYFPGEEPGGEQPPYIMWR